MKRVWEKIPQALSQLQRGLSGSLMTAA